MRPLLLTGGALFDGTGDALRGDAGIELLGDRISRVGRVADFGDAPEADVLDVSGRVVMPGLVNMHDHLIFKYMLGPPRSAVEGSIAPLVVHAARVAAATLAQGITTTRDMGTREGVAPRLRDLIDRGVATGPRVLTCNRALRVTGGHGNLGVQVDSPDAARAAARDQLTQGADFVKVMASHDPLDMPGPEQTRAEMPLEPMRAAFAVAHDWGRKATCHVMGTVAIGRAIDAGVDIVEHGVYLTPPLAERMAAGGVVYDPTLSAYMVQTMHPRFGRGEAWRSAHAALVDAHRGALAAALGAGVEMVVGTDSCGCYAEEVELLREGGMPAAATLRACTSTAARALGLEHEIGTVQPGVCADLVVLDGDPLEDPRALERVEYVIRAGVLHRPDALTLLETPGAAGNVMTLARMP